MRRACMAETAQLRARLHMTEDAPVYHSNFPRCIGGGFNQGNASSTIEVVKRSAGAPDHMILLLKQCHASDQGAPHPS
jgi:hypothetical protein